MVLRLRCSVTLASGADGACFVCHLGAATAMAAVESLDDFWS